MEGRRRGKPRGAGGARGRAKPVRRELGRVLHYVRTGHVVVEATWKGRPPSLGLKVAGPDGRVVGVLVDIIGPVERPYAVVRPQDSADPPPPGTVLYVLQPPPRAQVRQRREAGRRGRARPQRARGRGAGEGRRRASGRAGKRRG